MIPDQEKLDRLERSAENNQYLARSVVQLNELIDSMCDGTGDLLAHHAMARLMRRELPQSIDKELIAYTLAGVARELARIQRGTGD